MILFVSQLTTAQQDAWVYFSDKPNADFYLNNPLKMLSQRALDRRSIQNISLDLLDVPIHQNYVDQVAMVVPVLAKSKWLNAVHVRGSQNAITALTSLIFVDHIEFADKSLNIGNWISAKTEYSKSQNISQISFPYGDSANQIQMLNGHMLHQQNYTGSGKIIAIMDAGFPFVNTAPAFQRLRDNNLILGGYNFIAANNNIYTSNNHGTLVLSTMGGYIENGLVGTAPDAGYYLFITEDIENENPVEESFWVQAAEVADSLGVDVINTSLGYFDFDNPAYDHTYADLDGVTTFMSRGANIAFTRGMVVVASAGNDGATENPYNATPADAVNVLSVGAVDANGNYAAFSSIGPSYDGRIKPDVVAQGQQAVVAYNGNSVFTANGTSFSGPILAGMVATLWQAVPNKTNAEIVQLIKQSAHLYSNPNYQLGYGIPNFSVALANALSITDSVTSTFSAYPNPMHTSIAFNFNAVSGVVKLYNSFGQMVRLASISSYQEVRVDDLSSGLYFYEVTTSEKSYKGKLIKY